MPKPSGDKPLKCRELCKKLRKFGVQEFRKRGKGSERMLHHPNINGRPVWYPIKCHGEGDELSKHIVRAARERFNIKLEEFY
jgi:predicted RNA binding protein YcfA (HicA-like mRNA interferase family)